MPDMTKPRASWIAGRRSKWAVLGIWLAVVAVFAPLGAKLPDVTNDEVVLPSASETARANRILRERFPGGDVQPVLLVYRRAGGLTPADRARILADARRAAKVPLAGRPLVPFGRDAAAGLVAKQGDVAMTVVPLEAGKIFRVRPSIEELRTLRGTPGLEVHVTGTPALLNDFNSAVKEADSKLLLATGLLVLLLLLAVYRSPLLALVPLIVVAVAYSVATGVLYLLAKAGLPVDSVSTSLLLVLMFGAGTDYCLLLVARYRAQLRRTGDIHSSVANAIPAAAPAMIASGLTVIAAMLVMLAGILGLNRTIGPVNAIGIAIVLIAGLTLLPALLAALGSRAFWPVGAASRAADEGGRRSFATALGERVRKRPVAWLVATVVLLGTCAGGLSVYKLHADWFHQFREPTDSTLGFDVLKTRFPPGTLAPTTVLVERTEGAIRPADIDRVRAMIAQEPGVAAVVGPQRRSTDGRAAELSLLLADDPFGPDGLRRIGDLRTKLDALGPDLEVLLSEGSARQVDFKAAAARDFRVIAPLVLLVVLLTLIVLMRALVAPIYLLGTVILSYLATLGISLVVYRYLFGQDVVDPEFRLIVLIFLVALGSDYNIFLMSRVREEAARRGTSEGMMKAISATGPVITSAGIILAGTFSVLMVLPIWELFEIGFAVALGVLIDTFIVRSALVPAIVWLVGDRSWWPSSAAAGRKAPVTGSFPVLRPDPVRKKDGSDARP